MKKTKIKLPRLHPIPEAQKDIHTEHCCVLHGCKFNEDFDCPVVQARKPQSYICESCAHDGIINLDMLQEVRVGNKPKCPYCDHTLP